MNPPNNPNYHSYMVRLWRDNAAQAWRAAAHCTAARHVFQFADVDALFGFLLHELESGSNACESGFSLEFGKAAQPD